jgi:hypothetical protein
VSEPDVILLNHCATQEPTLQMCISEDRNKRCSTSAKDISSFPVGAKISKTCGPWGDYSLLFNSVFVIERKIYRASGALTMVLLKNVEAPHHEYMIELPFFGGWLEPSLI